MDFGKSSVSQHVVSHPGVVRYGNFFNYYSFNSVSQRLKAIPTDFLNLLKIKNEPFLCLDIGCNSGDMTFGLYEHLVTTCRSQFEIIILGIDLDEVLIARCNETNKYQNNIFFDTLNIIDKKCAVELKVFFKKYNRTEFDLITCFSTTMWIHLNHGDKGFDKFLCEVVEISRYFLVEPQEWKSYKATIRRLTRLNEKKFDLNTLQIRNIFYHLEQFLTDNGGELIKNFGETSWGRQLYLFANSCIT